MVPTWVTDSKMSHVVRMSDIKSFYKEQLQPEWGEESEFRCVATSYDNETIVVAIGTEIDIDDFLESVIGDDYV